MEGLARYLGLVAVPVLFVLIAATTESQTATKEGVQAYIKSWVAAYTSHDTNAIVRLDPPTPGFGFRDLQPRSADRPYLDALKTFFASKEYYRVELNELHADVDGNVGLAWGFFTEDFKDKDRAPEKVRVRFTTTLKYDSGKWRPLLFHRDIQQFDPQGRYFRSP